MIMKKIIFALSIGILMLNCKDGGNKGVVAQENTITEEKFRYVAEDGSNTHITFINDNGNEKIKIFSNNKTITLPKTNTTTEGNLYAEHDIEVRTYGDSLSITQGNAIILLKKARGQ